MAEHPSSMWVLFSVWAKSDPLIRMAEHPFSLWVALQCLSRSDPLTWTSEHIQFVSPLFFSVWADLHWPEWLNTHPECESSSVFEQNQIHWPEWLNTHPGSESFSVFERIRSTDQNGWTVTPIQRVSLLQCSSLSRSDPLTGTAEHPSRLWVALQYLSKLDLLTGTAEHGPSRMWVALKCLSRLDPLTWMAEHPSRMWVTLRCLSRSHLLTRMAEHPSSMWVFFSVWADHIHWPEWLNTHPACECLSVSDPVLTRMAEHPSSMWVGLQRSDWLTWTAEHPSSMWVTLLCLSRSHLEWLNTHPECESLSSVSTGQIHWSDPEWLIIHPGCESLFNHLSTDNSESENGWTQIQHVSYPFSVQTFDKNDYYCISRM